MMTIFLALASHQTDAWENLDNSDDDCVDIYGRSDLFVAYDHDHGLGETRKYEQLWLNQTFCDCWRVLQKNQRIGFQSWENQVLCFQ